MDAQRNSFYLNECIQRVQAFIDETGEEVAGYKKKSPEKRPLLASC